MAEEKVKTESSNGEKETLINTYRMVFASLGWITLLARQVVSCTDGDCLSMYQFYTIQSNLLVLVWYTLALMWRNDQSQLEKIMGPIKGAITLYITVTFLVFASLLEPLYNPTGFDLFTSLIHHYITPIAFIGDWILSERTPYYWEWILHWLVFPILYLMFSLVLGAITDFYPYYFLNPVELGIKGLLGWIGIFLLLFAFLGFVYILINQRVFQPKGPSM